MLAIPQAYSLIRRSLGPRPDAPLDNAMARYEMKYLVDVRLREPIRAFASLFCQPDPYCTGDPPAYRVETLQLDSPWGDLHLAKEQKAVNRFKLRARTYGGDSAAPLFLEIKRKIGDVVVKSRACFGPGWGDLRELVLGGTASPLLKPGHEMAFLEFRRLVQQMGAAPVMLLRYQRESYISENDQYARVTFDHDMHYQRCRAWSLAGPEGGWSHMDTATTLNRPFPAFVLELKSTGNMPTWMAELIERFNLVRCDFCKYASAMRMDSLYRGFHYSDASENCTY